MNEPVYAFDTKILKVSPFGDVAVSVCRMCGAVAGEEDVHFAWHRATGTEEM